MNKNIIPSIIAFTVIALIITIANFVLFWPDAEDVEESRTAPVENTISNDEDNEIEREEEQTPAPADNAPTAWMTYTSQKHGFSFNYPPNTTISSDQFPGNEYIRLENYTPSDDMRSLAAGNYYMELYVYDRSVNQALEGSCATVVENGNVVTADGVTVVRGFDSQPPGDAGGERSTLCAQNGDFDLVVNVTESTKGEKIASKILDSFSF